MSDLASISSLINPTDDEDSVTGRFAKKQKEIKNKEMEAATEKRARALDLDYVNLFAFPVSPEALALIPEDRARELEAICFFYDGRDIRLGCLKPTAAVRAELENLSRQYFAAGKLYLISPTSWQNALEAYKTLPKVKKIAAGVEISAEKLEKFKDAIGNYRNLNEQINSVNITDVVTLMLATAIKVAASDIHIEAEESGISVRLRIDGVLQTAATIKREKWPNIISRLKILARVKINISDQPQDGRFSIYLQKRKIDVRCSFLPTAFGESVAMRLLDSATTVLDLTSLGLRAEVRPKLEKEVAKPNGLILTTGPTGSGKTTTLYAVLKQLNKPGTKIITLEDPIEYQLSGVNQSQVDERHGYSFADGLRSLLRQDPNVVMVGEIRDLETAEISIQAALTGHLVLSTLHTNDAAGVIPRLLDIGVKPYFLVPAINAVVGQRLVRRLCPHCRQEHKLNALESEQVNRILAVISPKAGVSLPAELPKIYRSGEGCEACNFIGYKGRIGIFEIFTMTENLKQLTVDKAPAFKILQQAIENGMITMLQDGVLKVLEGVTSLDEIYRVVGNFDYVDELYDIVISQTIGRGVKIKSEEMVRTKELSRDLKQAHLGLKDVSTNELINIICALAAINDASDIHIEPEENDVKIRFRLDGVMYDILSLPKTTYLTLIAAIKILAGAPTNIKRATFDGRFTIYLPDHKVDCRLSIITGGYGESVVVRLLSTPAANLDMEKLGLTGPALAGVKEALKKTRGIIINTGPTGSGKTTTLYSLLNQLNKPDVKIITVEDPIEYQLPGVMQTQIDEARGYTFASAMRSLLRQNPNIMMIGEIRDEETAKIAIEAAMTGHLVLSTIHANSAAGAISRFTGLGVERQSLANAIEFTIGQRLVRRLCPQCKRETKLNATELERVKKILAGIKNPDVKIPEKLVFYESPGCTACGGLGYKGQLGLYETIAMDPEIQKIMQQETVTDAEIEAAAGKAGMVTMLQDGVLKALKGETSLAEVWRVV